MTACKFCGATMTSAPSHMDHEAACGRLKLWSKIREYTAACIGGIESGRAKSLAADIDALINKGVHCTHAQRGQP